MAKRSQVVVDKDSGAVTVKEVELFAKSQEDQIAEDKREQDRKVDLLITPKGHQRLRAFGYEVVKLAEALPASTSDRRSL